MIAIRANDAAARALGFAFDHEDADVEPLGSRIQAAGLARDEAGGLYVPGVSLEVDGGSDLTDREVERNTWHLEDHPDIHPETDGRLGAKAQVQMLKQGIALARVVRELAEQLPDRPATCCVTAVNESKGTFCFYELRDGENWLDSNVNAYPNDLIIAIEARPATA